MSGIAVFVNPRSGRGRAARLWELLRAEDSRIATARVVHGPSADAARAELDDVLAGGVERVLVIGGDGTTHLVANAMLERGLGGRVALGLIPSGTGSDLARTLEVPRDPKAALALALSDRCHLIDVLRLEADDGRRRYAVNVASAGISGVVDEAMHALPRRSAVSYLTTTLGALARYRNVPCRVTVDGAVWREGDVLLVAVANGHTFGNGMRVAPHARCDDGEADVVLVNPVPRALLPFRLPQIYLGTHLSAGFVRWGRARRVRIEPLAPMPPFDLDGEPFPSAAATITLEGGALLVARGVGKPARAPSRREKMRATPGKGSDASC